MGLGWGRRKSRVAVIWWGTIRLQPPSTIKSHFSLAYIHHPRYLKKQSHEIFENCKLFYWVVKRLGLFYSRYNFFKCTFSYWILMKPILNGELFFTHTKQLQSDSYYSTLAGDFWSSSQKVLPGYTVLHRAHLPAIVGRLLMLLTHRRLS